MSLRSFLSTMIFILALPLALLQVAAAEVVGHFTQVEGRVDLLKSGNLPAIPVKIQDGVEPGDVLRTKSLSKAQITFVDNSVMTISPESRVRIEAYMFDPAQNKRNAVVQLFQGLAHVVVSKVFKAAEPDFVVKTHTAIMGVRGTEFGIRLQPNSSSILNFEGVLQVGNVFPEVGQLFRKAFKVAYSFGSGGGGGRWVFLKGMQGTSVGRGMPPTAPFAVSPADQKAFMGQLAGGLTSRKSGGDSGGGSVAGGVTSGSGSSGTSGSEGGTGGGSTTSYAVDLGTAGTGGTSPLAGSTGLMGGEAITQLPGTNLVIVSIPPNPSPSPSPGPSPSPSVAQYTFQYIQGYSVFTPISPTQATVTYNTWGFRSPTGDTQSSDIYSGYFTSSVTATRATGSDSSPFPSSRITEVYMGTMTGTLSGASGSPLSGSMSFNGYTTNTSNPNGGTSVSYAGPVTIDPSGGLTFSYANGTFSQGSISGTETSNGTQTPGEYFWHGSAGSTRSSSRSPYKKEKIQNNYPVWGNLSIDGAIISTRASFSLVNKATENNSFLPSNLGAFSNLLNGVVSVDPNTGVRTGVATSWFGDNPSTGTYGNRGLLAGPVTIDPPYNLKATLYGADYSSTFSYPGASQSSPATQVITWTQSPQTMPESSTYRFMQTYSGYSLLSPGAISNTANIEGYAWGQRTGVSDSYFVAQDNGTRNTLSSSGGGYDAYMAGSVQVSGRMMGSVTGVLGGQDLTGRMVFQGIESDGVRFTYRGDVTLQADGSMVFNYKG